jgi:hypothetical protein
VPHRHDPERFHIEKSEIERALGKLASRFAAEPCKPAQRRHVTVSTLRVNGRAIRVQETRKPFAIFVGGTRG